MIAVEPSPTGTEDSAADIVAAVGLLEQQFEYARARAALQAAPSGLAKQPLPTQPIARRPGRHWGSQFVHRPSLMPNRPDIKVRRPGVEFCSP